jgi:hypothetical protein
MANVKNIAKTMRNLVHNAGAWGTGPYMYTVAGSNIIEFYAAANDKSTPYPMAFKPGATIYHDGLYFTATIQGGASHLWTMDQVAEKPGTATRTSTCPTRPRPEAEATPTPRAPPS